MAICTDPALTYLNRFGYNVVRLPRTGIEPLDVLGRAAGSMERLGRLEQMWDSSVAAPTPKAPEKTVKVSGKRSNEVHLSIGLKVLEPILSGLGASTAPGLRSAYRKAKKVVFTFADTDVVGIDPLVVGKYLTAGDLDSDNPVVESYFGDEEKSAFLIWEVLKSKAITVSALDSSGAEVDLDVPAIQQAVGGEVKVKTANEAKGELTYEGETAITFGFKCSEIAYVDGEWTFEGASPDADLAFAAPRAARGPIKPVVLGRGRVLV